MENPGGSRNVRSHSSSRLGPARWWSFFTLASLGMLAVVGRCAAAAHTPKEVVCQVSESLIPVLQQKDLSAGAKREKIRNIVVGYVDFPTMARLILARNWNGLDDAKKKEFV